MQDVKYPLELNHTASTYSPTPPHWRPEEFFNDWIRSVRVTQTGDWDTSTTATVDIYIMFLKLSVWTFISWSVATEYVHCKARPGVVQHWVMMLPSPAAVYNVKTSRHRNTAKYEHHGTSLQFKGASVFSWVEMASDPVSRGRIVETWRGLTRQHHSAQEEFFSLQKWGEKMQLVKRASLPWSTLGLLYCVWKIFVVKKSKPTKILGSDYGFCELLALGFDATVTTCH